MLNNMYEYGYITKEELEENYDADLVLNYDKGGASTSNGSTVFTWYTEAVFDEAVELLMRCV